VVVVGGVVVVVVGGVVVGGCPVPAHTAVVSGLLLSSTVVPAAFRETFRAALAL
jgi:hypothetical protein